MCIGFPGKIISIDADNYAVIDIGGTRREVSLALMGDPVKPGDYVVCHVGYAINRVDEAAALESLKLLEEIISHEAY